MVAAERKRDDGPAKVTEFLLTSHSPKQCQEQDASEPKLIDSPTLSPDRPQILSEASAVSQSLEQPLGSGGGMLNALTVWNECHVSKLETSELATYETRNVHA